MVNSFPICIFLIQTLLYSLSALVENRIFSVHGGLSPSIQSLDQVSRCCFIAPPINSSEYK